MKQSLQFYLPKLNPPRAFKDFVNQDITDQKFIAHCEDMNKSTLKSKLKSKQDYTILIGPEGDFTVKERENILKLKKLIPLKINQNILRSETAAISMISIISFNLLS